MQQSHPQEGRIVSVYTGEGGSGSRWGHSKYRLEVLLLVQVPSVVTMLSSEVRTSFN